MNKYPPIQIGQEFGRLTVISDVIVRSIVRSDGHNEKVPWRQCQCDCGVKLEVRERQLNAGQKSCGCLQREVARSQGKANTRHRETIGKNPTPEYRAWQEMKRRCLDVNRPYAKNYVNRGIAVCQRWLDSFENFLEDMGRKPSPELTLERRNNERGYSPDNCYWATMKQQNRNRRSNKFLTVNGETHCYVEWEEILSLPPRTISQRVNRGMLPEEAILPIKQIRTNSRASMKS